MQYAICEVFTGMNPIMIRQYSAHEVFLLVKRLNKRANRTSKEGNKPKKLRRPAGDDWF